MFALRFILQWIRAGYQNPLAQFVLQITEPLVVPARRVLPSVRGIDLPTLIVIFALECVATLLLFVLVRVSAVDRCVLRRRSVAARQSHVVVLLRRTFHLRRDVLARRGDVQPERRDARRDRRAGLASRSAGCCRRSRASTCARVIVLILLQAVIYALPRWL